MCQLIDKNGVSENEPTQAWPIDVTKLSKYIMEKGYYFEYIELEKVDIHMQKNEIRPLSHTIHKNQLKMD
jgi:hypothetical protein